MIDELAGTAANDLRGTITSDLDAGLLELYAGHRRRRHQNLAAAAAAAAVAIALGVGWWGGHAMTRETPVGPPNPGPTQGVGTTQTCSGAVACLGPATYRFPLTRPVTWHIPGGYHVSSGHPMPWMVGAEAQRVQQGGGPYQYDTLAGVTVLEGVRAASTEGRTAAAHVADTPQAFVSWLAAQHFLDASPITSTRMDGLPAWHVRVALGVGGNGPALCNGKVACYPLTVTPDQTMNGIWGSMVADLTAFRLPGAGTTVVWSWAFSHDQGALARNRSAVRGLTWPTG
jgi:hypothetical protein